MICKRKTAGRTAGSGPGVGVFVWLLVPALALLPGSARRAGGEENGKQAAPTEIRQGGYVEKVDPNVDYKERLPRIDPKEPAESLQSFHLLPGFRLEQVATEPLVRDPVEMAFDENGRLYVAEIIPYAEGNASKYGSPNGRVSMLEDTDGDGKFDRSTVFVDKLVWPTGVTCFDGGLFIVAAPDVLYCKDRDGDGRADTREVVVTGFAVSNPNSIPNSLRWGLDNRLHGMTSLTGGLLRAVKWAGGGAGREVKEVQARGRDFRIHPRTGQLWLESGGAQFGMALDRWGRKFESINNAPILMVMYEDRYLARNPFLAAPSPRKKIWVDGPTVYPTSPAEPWRIVRTEMRAKGVFSGSVEGGGKSHGYFTAACGVTIYQGDAWPEQYRGNAFVCEGANHLVHRMRLEPDGVALAAHRVERKCEFLTSDEIWFRPIQLANAPDGNLYLADMYREVFEHPDAVPPSAKKYLDLTRGNDRGRIYRIVPDGFEQPEPPRLGRMTTPELVALLAAANGWHRTTASRLLYERQDRQALAPLRQMAANPASPVGRMHALYALDGMGALTADTVLPRLADDHPRVREHAVRLAEKVLASSPAVRQKLYELAGDSDPRVRYQLAFTLGEIPGAQATAALARITARDAADSWVRLAVLSSSLGRAGSLFAELAADASWRATPAGRALLEQLAEQAGLQNRRDQIAEVLLVLDKLGDAERDLAQRIVHGLSNGLKQVGSPLPAELAAGGTAGKVLAELVADSRRAALDETKPIARRVEAIRSLALARYEEAADILPELLDGRQPQELQVAALQTLSRFQGSEVGRMIVDAWAGFSPGVRAEAAEALFARPERLLLLLSAVQDNVIKFSELDPARIEFLRNHPDSSIRDEALKTFAGLHVARREDVVLAYRDVLAKKGDRQRGKAVFKRECSICHRLEGVGYDLGLPLATVQSRGREGILTQILDPNREVLPAYLNYMVLTDDGRTFTGMIAAETATSITLKRAEDQTDTLLRIHIDEMRGTGLSVMPEGLEKQVSKEQMADLIEYLMTIP